MTTRGFREAEMREVASCIAAALHGRESESELEAVRRRVQTLTEKFPLYSWRMAHA